MPASGLHNLRKHYAGYLDQGEVEHVWLTPRPEAGQGCFVEPFHAAAPARGRRIDFVCHIELELLEHFQ